MDCSFFAPRWVCPLYLSFALSRCSLCVTTLLVSCPGKYRLTGGPPGSRLDLASLIELSINSAQNEDRPGSCSLSLVSLRCGSRMRGIRLFGGIWF